jgi:hypothetical protein
MNARQELAFGNLLAAWRRREEARSLDIRTLAEARSDLDQARMQMRSTVTGLR